MAVATNNCDNIFSLFLQSLKIFWLWKYCICGSISWASFLWAPRESQPTRRSCHFMS
jgi:hypothetical protein